MRQYRPREIEKMCRDAYVELANIFGKEGNTLTWNSLSTREQTLISSIVGHVLYKLAQEDTREQQLFDIVKRVFAIEEVSDVRKCRECGVPVVHMEHLKLGEAKDIEAHVRELLRADEGE